MLEKPVGGYIESAGKTLDLILTTHFPGCHSIYHVKNGLIMHGGPMQKGSLSRLRTGSACVMYSKVNYTIESFISYKSSEAEWVDLILTHKTPPSTEVLLFESVFSRVVSSYQEGCTDISTPKSYKQANIPLFLLTGGTREAFQSVSSR